MEVVLRVGRKGEIYTTKELREKAGIRENGLVRAMVLEGKVVLEPIPTVEELLGEEAVVKVSPEEVERLSVEVQRERGVYGGEAGA
ncbi:MAG: AbrB/MazE/SpoVT family DNA-binding domain-containing protein [Candidatus Verstraetearchaeota archaeon]|nr:AbrB/MazE/SpoVT family DNA-binding domain-containing protein [Candidatus Verstraetearchaeota archaeon]